MWVKKCRVCERDHIWNSSSCSCENEKYITSIMHDSVIMYDEIIESYEEETKTIPASFNEKKATSKMQNFYVLVAFLLITIALLIAVSIYCYLIKHRTKQKHLLPFHAKKQLKEFIY